jgi:hypothetical protein
MYLGNNAALLGCQEYFNRCAAAGSPIGATQTPSSYDNAASFNGTNQFLSNSSFAQSGSFTLSFWVNTSPPGLIGVINKGLATSNVSDWSLFKTGTSLCFAGSSAGQQSPAIATISLTQWNFVVVTYDATSLVKSIQVNNGTVSSNAGTTAFSNTYSQINLSCLNGSYFSGSMAGVGYWNRVLSASEVTALWNNGAGRTYASLDSTLRTNLISWWALNQSSVTADSHGTNTLTNNGSVTAPNIGPVVTARSDPRQLIIDFAQGIDRLGLWNSMVCWPLRSSQNAASGSTAFSLGGLGQFNGTLVNAPVWGADGVSGFLQSSSRRIETSVGYNFSTQNSIFACARKTAAGDLRLVGQSNETPLFVGTTEIRYFNGANAGGTATHPGTNVRSTYSHAFGSSTVVGMVNGGAPVTSAYSPNNLAIQFFIGQGGLNGWVGDISFFAYFSQQVATSAHSQLHSLYRQTLGLGLGLP